MDARESRFEIKANMGVFAGRGSLPRELAGYLRKKGHEPFILGIKGETEPWIEDYNHRLFVWGKLGSFFRYLQNNNIKQVVFAGGVTRPALRLRDLDMGGVISLSRVMAFMIGGDNSLLTGLIKLFDQHGVEVVGAHEVMPGLLTPAGIFFGRKPGKKAMLNIEKAFEACKTLGALDIGQAAVAVGGRVVAVEGIEGTDAMLERIAAMRVSGKLYENGRHGVLVKTMKPDQDMRADLPSIGPNTIDGVVEAKLRGIAIEAGYSMILDREETLEKAKASGVFIYGLTPTDNGNI